MPRSSYMTAAQIKRGKFQLADPARWTAAMREFRDGAVIASVTSARTVSRSAAANAAYWAGYIRPLCSATGNDPYALHGYLKHRYLEPERIVICDVHGEIKDERDIPRPTTVNLSPREFSEYLQHIEVFASDLGVSVGSHR